MNTAISSTKNNKARHTSSLPKLVLWDEYDGCCWLKMMFQTVHFQYVSKIETTPHIETTPTDESWWEPTPIRQNTYKTDVWLHRWGIHHHHCHRSSHYHVLHHGLPFCLQGDVLKIVGVSIEKSISMQSRWLCGLQMMKTPAPFTHGGLK